MELTHKEEELFKKVRRTGDWNLFTERYFKLPYSGTWFTPEDRVERYEMLYDIWSEVGKPDDEFQAQLDGGEPVAFKIAWDGYYQGYPMFLLPHGFRTMPWMREFLDLSATKAVAVTGTGSGKTAGCAIRALVYCALFPGFRFLNIAPKQVQAELALNEVEKWAGNTEFSKFIKKSRGAHDLWVERPYPTITVEVVEGYPSTFVCQTVGQDATAVLGGERDWINADEAQLLEGIEESQEILATRLRGTRVTGVPRSTKLTWITNPGSNPELQLLIDQYEELRKKGDKSVLVLTDINTSDNIYLTEHQKKEQRKVLGDRARDRWHDGQMSAVTMNSEIGEQLVIGCEDVRMNTWAEEHGKYIDGLGLMRYQKKPSPDRTYIVAGDTGKSSIASLSSQNIPAIMVLDVTDFLERPMELSALYWFDGKGDYKTFVSAFEHAMVRYQARGYYDATNVQTAFEDLDESFRHMPTTPVYFSGTGHKKRWAVAIAVHLMADQQFKWPTIKALRHQARVFKYASKKQPEDVLDALLVFCLSLRMENTFWDRLTRQYKWDPEDIDGLEVEDSPKPRGPDKVYRKELGRYDRVAF